MIDRFGVPLPIILSDLQLEKYGPSLAAVGFAYSHDLASVTVQELMQAEEVKMSWGHARRLVNHLSSLPAPNSAMADDNSTPATLPAPVLVPSPVVPSGTSTKKRKYFTPESWAFLSNEVKQWEAWKSSRGDGKRVGAKGTGTKVFVKTYSKEYPKNALMKWRTWINRLKSAGV